MKKGGELEKWLNTAAPGHCPCGTLLPPGHSVLCASKACRTKYDSLMTKDRRPPSFLREVKSHGDVENRPRQVRMNLACGHFRDTHRSTAQAVGTRARCLVCQEEAAAPKTPPTEAPESGG